MKENESLINKVHRKVHGLKTVRNWTKPKIYTGKDFDISKDWYIYYSFRNPKTGLLERQTNIKRGNRFKSKIKRLEVLKVYRDALEELLEEGFNPYEMQQQLQEESTIDFALDFAMKHKSETWSETNLHVMKARVNVFKEFLKEERLINRPPDHVTKKVVNKFLDRIMHSTSPANRNNYRSGLSPLFTFMVNRDLIDENPFLKIPKLKTKQKGNKVFSQQLKKDVTQWMKENDPVLLQFIQVFTFGMIRPIEAVRLQVKDINLKEGFFYVNSKQKKQKKKIISRLLAEALPDISKADPEAYVMTKTGEPGKWNRSDSARREFFTKRFVAMRDVLKFDKDLKMYNFRHTIISEIYSKLVAEHGDRRSVQLLMEMTGHSSEAALNHYLQKIDAHLPSDFSKYIE